MNPSMFAISLERLGKQMDREDAFRRRRFFTAPTCYMLNSLREKKRANDTRQKSADRAKDAVVAGRCSTLAKRLDAAITYLEMRATRPPVDPPI